MPAFATKRLQLVPITLDAILAVLDHDRERAEAVVGARFPDSWPSDELLVVGFPYSRDAIRAAPEERLWGDSLVLLEGNVIGSVIFHGRPNHGVAEIGYAIEQRYRNSGYATEATRACVEWALGEPAVDAVQATTFEWHLASLGVIRGCGMQQIAVRDHDTLGSLLVFERRR